MIRVHYQVTCDWCGAFKVSCQTCLSEAVRRYSLEGGVCRNELHFCGNRCLNLYLRSHDEALAEVDAPIAGSGQRERG